MFKIIAHRLSHVNSHQKSQGGSGNVLFNGPINNHPARTDVNPNFRLDCGDEIREDLKTHQDLFDLWWKK